MKTRTRRYLASWLLLAVFLPMLLLSSVHMHQHNRSVTDSECIDCFHHNCHGHLSQTAAWSHDCVLCQFLTLTMLTASSVVIALFIHVSPKHYAQPLYGSQAGGCGMIVTRGPPTC